MPAWRRAGGRGPGGGRRDDLRQRMTELARTASPIAVAILACRPRGPSTEGAAGPNEADGRERGRRTQLDRRARTHTYSDTQRDQHSDTHTETPTHWRTALSEGAGVASRPEPPGEWPERPALRVRDAVTSRRHNARSRLPRGTPGHSPALGNGPRPHHSVWRVDTSAARRALWPPSSRDHLRCIASPKVDRRTARGHETSSRGALWVAADGPPEPPAASLWCHCRTPSTTGAHDSGQWLYCMTVRASRRRPR